jgi:GntR family transcriptional regulator
MINEKFILDDNPLIPIYHKLAQAIKRKIISGEIKEGDYIPSEAQLTEMFGISRTTARLAIQELCKEGLLERYRGKGTIVNRQKLMREFPGWSSFTEETKRMGKTPGTIIISAEAMPPPNKEIAESLALHSDEKVICLLRKRYVDNEFLGVSESYFSQALWNTFGITDPFQLNNKSIYEYLENRGIRLLWAKETIEAVITDKKLATVVESAPGTPLLIITRVVYGPEDKPIEVGINKFRADRYKVCIIHKRYQ